MLHRIACPWAVSCRWAVCGVSKKCMHAGSHVHVAVSTAVYRRNRPTRQMIAPQIAIFLKIFFEKCEVGRNTATRLVSTFRQCRNWVVAIAESTGGYVELQREWNIKAMRKSWSPHSQLRLLGILTSRVGPKCFPVFRRVPLTA